MTEIKSVKVLKQDHHRNGVGGAPFDVVLFKHEGEKFLAIVFDEPGCVAVLGFDKLKQEVIEFGENSWRGDWFEDALREVIER